MSASRPVLRRPGRSSGMINLGLAVGAIALLLPLLLNAATASPPTAAEFSPNASQVIKQAPPGEAGSSNGQGEGGSGEGGPGGSGTSTTLPTKTEQISSNLLKNCVGPPPERQIEDPQSPPCIAYWEGDNGGTTWQGVTRDSIHIAVPTPNGFREEYEALENFFNKRFQLYGRKIVFHYCVPTAGRDSQGSGDQTRQTADAAQAAAGCEGGPKPFASTFYQFDNGPYYNQEMACRHKVVTVGSWQPFDRRYLGRCSPYLYNYPLASEDIFSRIGDWSCAQLVGRPARWASGSTSPTGPAVSDEPRNFGIFLAPYTSDDPVTRRDALDGLVDRLRQCGAEVPESQIIINPVGQTSPGVAVDPASANNAILQMKQAGVSSIICLCGTFPFGALARAASSNDYRPEWIGSTFGGLDQVVILALAAAPAEQLQRLFGMTFAPRQIDPLLEPYNAAFQEGDPALGPRTASTDYSNYTQVYRPLLMLVSGLQMAGPKLTPQTFLEGLRKTRFPNPITRLNAGAVGLAPDGHTFTADAALWWWSNTAQGPYSDDAAGKGAICYVDGGARRTLGTWPKAEPKVFTSTCDAG